MTLRKRKWMVKSRRGAHSQSPIPSSLPQHSYFTIQIDEGAFALSLVLAP